MSLVHSNPTAGTHLDVYVLHEAAVTCEWVVCYGLHTVERPQLVGRLGRDHGVKMIQVQCWRVEHQHICSCLPLFCVAADEAGDGALALLVGPVLSPKVIEVGYDYVGVGPDVGVELRKRWWRVAVVWQSVEVRPWVGAKARGQGRALVQPLPPLC
jgi:hypothetical protein